MPTTHPLHPISKGQKIPLFIIVPLFIIILALVVSGGVIMVALTNPDTTVSSDSSTMHMNH